jgi:hypothetical protein
MTATTNTTKPVAPSSVEPLAADLDAALRRLKLATVRRTAANAPAAGLTQTTPTSILNNAPRWSHPPGNQVVPSPWQATGSALSADLGLTRARDLRCGRSLASVIASWLSKTKEASWPTTRVYCEIMSL